MILMSKLAIAAMMQVDKRCDELGWAYAEHHENGQHEILLFGPKGDEPQIQTEAESRCKAWELLAQEIAGLEINGNTN